MIDFCPVDTNTEQGPQRHPGESLQDTGASASAGADESVKGLLASLIKIAPETLIELDSSYTGRPWFRFGNGEWGQALYKMTATSRTLYQNRYGRQFTCFALPSPNRESKEQAKTETEQTSLEQYVPVLAGMDFMSANGMITDHKNGWAVFADYPDEGPFKLNYSARRNGERHFLIDIIHYLTGYTCRQVPDNHCVVNFSPIIKLRTDSASSSSGTANPTSPTSVTLTSCFFIYYAKVFLTDCSR